jgi:hypothetical protein
MNPVAGFSATVVLAGIVFSPVAVKDSGVPL